LLDSVLQCVAVCNADRTARILYAQQETHMTTPKSQVSGLIIHIIQQRAHFREILPSLGAGTGSAASSCFPFVVALPFPPCIALRSLCVCCMCHFLVLMGVTDSESHRTEHHGEYSVFFECK